MKLENIRPRLPHTKGVGADRRRLPPSARLIPSAASTVYAHQSGAA
jgi:hypothetical protein